MVLVMHKQYSNRQHHLIVVRNQFWWVWPRLFWRFCSFCLPLKQPKFPFRPWPWGSIVHGGQKKNWLKKFMQVEVAVKCMQTNFGKCGLACFGDFAHFFVFKTAKIPFLSMGIKK